MAHKGPRILLFDIESTHNVVASFDLRDEYTPHTNILQERYIICACYQWLGENKIHSVSVLDDPKRYAKNPHDDYHVVKTLLDLFEEADVLVGHNADQFDIKYVVTRGLKHGFKPSPPTASIDTYKIAKAKFKFNSNRLDYLARFLGFGKKIHTDVELWLDVLHGSQKAIHQMVTYNKHDVVLLRKVFETFIPYIPNHLSRELFGGIGCPRCGSHKIQSRGVHRAITKVYQRFQCQGCAGWFRELKSTVKQPVKFRVL